MRMRRRSRKAACNLSQVLALSARNRCSRKIATSSNAEATEKMCNFGDTLAQRICYKGEERPRIVLLTDSSSKGFVWRRIARRKDARGTYAQRPGEGAASFGFGQELQGHQGPRKHRGGRGGTWGGQVGAPRGQQGRVLTAGAS